MANGKDTGGGESPPVVSSDVSPGFGTCSMSAKAAVVEKSFPALMASILSVALAGEPDREFKVSLRVESVNG